MVGRPGIIISPKEKLLSKEVAITIQELASKRVIGPEALVKVQLKGLKLERAWWCLAAIYGRVGEGESYKR